MAARLELLERQLGKLEAERTAHHARMAELATEEDLARQEALEQAPTQRSDSAGASSKVGRLRRKRKETEAALGNLESEIAALEVVLRRERERAAHAQLQDAIRQAAPLSAAELEGWRELGRKFAELYEISDSKVVANAEAKDSLDSEFRSNGVFGSGDADLQNRYLEAFKPLITPFPIDFSGVLEKLVQVSMDLHGEGYRVTSGEAAMSAKRSDWSRPRRG